MAAPQQAKNMGPLQPAPQVLSGSGGHVSAGMPCGVARAR
jgi:hypothetical protein